MFDWLLHVRHGSELLELMSSISVEEYRKQFGGGRKTGAKTKRPKRGGKVESEGESLLSLQLKALKIAFEREFKFCQDRKWRADFHLVDKMILIEVEGGIWSQGRHTRGKGYQEDMVKYNSAQVLGYSVYRYSTEQVKSGKAIDDIRRLVGDL